MVVWLDLLRGVKNQFFPISLGASLCRIEIAEAFRSVLGSSSAACLDEPCLPRGVMVYPFPALSTDLCFEDGRGALTSLLGLVHG